MTKLRRIQPRHYDWRLAVARTAVYRPSADRRRKMLTDAAAGKLWVTSRPPRDALRYDGVSLHDKELKRLVRAGLLEVRRVATGKGWGGPLDKYFYGNHDIRRTRVFITEAGWAAIFAERDGVAAPVAKTAKPQEKRPMRRAARR